MRAGKGRGVRAEKSTTVKQTAVLGLLVVPLLIWWVRGQSGLDGSAHVTDVASIGSTDFEGVTERATPASDDAAPSSTGYATDNGHVLSVSRQEDSAQLVEWKIVSGLSNVQISQQWEDKGFGTTFEFLEALNDAQIASQFGVPAPMTEGWILSDTYRFAKRTPARKVVRMMLSEFRRQADALLSESTQRYPNLSETEMLTLASIIEKESRDRPDRRRVSSVYHNRLRQGMRLEADPTLAFALGNPDRMLRNRDRWVQSPHNTYKNTGLPPAPICNISLDSLNAAVYPDETDYLFFVSMGNGRHYYSRTYREHLEAVERYRSRRLANAR